MNVKQKSALILVLALVFVAVFSVGAVASEPACPMDATCPIDKYTDTANDGWYHDGIHYCLENGLMTGVADTLFAPGGTANRGMIVTILYRLEGEPAFMNENTFTDVEEGAWYEKAVIWASGKGIVSGYGNDKFGPKNPITREQFATILYKYAQYKEYDVSVGLDTNILSYEDAFDINDWAMEALCWACGAGVMTGNNGYLRPGDTATRAEVAAMFQRSAIAWGLDPDDPGIETGGWQLNTDFAEASIPEDAADAFAEAMKQFDGVGYTPVAFLGSQPVAGINYAYLCKTANVAPNANLRLCVVKVYKPLNGEATVTDVEDLNISDYTQDSQIDFPAADLAGGWYVNDIYGDVLPESARAAFDKATAGMMGVGYTPAALLGTQVVAGVNYAVLCSATQVTADPATALAVMVIYADLQGNAQITSICGFEL